MKHDKCDTSTKTCASFGTGPKFSLMISSLILIRYFLSVTVQTPEKHCSYYLLSKALSTESTLTSVCSLFFTCRVALHAYFYWFYSMCFAEMVHVVFKAWLNGTIYALTILAWVFQKHGCIESFWRVKGINV